MSLFYSFLWLSNIPLRVCVCVCVCVCVSHLLYPFISRWTFRLSNRFCIYLVAYLMIPLERICRCGIVKNTHWYLIQIFKLLLEMLYQYVSTGSIWKFIFTHIFTNPSFIIILNHCQSSRKNLRTYWSLTCISLLEGWLLFSFVICHRSQVWIFTRYKHFL